MSRNDALSDRQMLEKIKDQLERQEKTALLRFWREIAATLIGVSVTVWLAWLGLGKTTELGWLTLIPLLGGLLIIYWSCLEFRRNYRKSFAVSGSILFVAGVLTLLTLPTLAAMFPCIAYRVRIAVVCLVALLILLGSILTFLAPRCIRKNRV